MIITPFLLSPNFKRCGSWGFIELCHSLLHTRKLAGVNDFSQFRKLRAHAFGEVVIDN
jgi:hypothetical protein